MPPEKFCSIKPAACSAA